MKKIAIIVSEFNPKVTNSLLSCCVEELKKHKVKNNQIKVIHVPGAYEIPFAASELARTKKYSAIICLGCIIKGETSHDKHIAGWVSTGVGMVSLNYRLPVLFGVLTPNNERQAAQRAKKGPLNRGKEVAEAAIKLIRLKKELK